MNELDNLYHQGSRALQDRYDTRRLADRLGERLVADTIDDTDREFIERMDMFFLATADEHGKPQCSYKGGDPGFVLVLDDKTIAFPYYDGDGMYFSAGNVLRNPQVGLLFIDFERRRRTRLNGIAEIAFGDPLLARFPEAQFLIRVRVREVFPNCPRYIHRLKLTERSKYVPRKKHRTPVPDWKQWDWVAEVLPDNDPARQSSNLPRHPAAPAGPGGDP